MPYMRGVAEWLGDVAYLDNAQMQTDRIQTSQVLVVRSTTKCTEALLSGTNVRFIATATAGVDHIDAEYCASSGITFANAPGCNATSVAQYVFSALSHLSLRDGYSLQGKTIGIVGVGHVGKEVLRLARAMDMKTLLYDPPRAEKEGAEGFCTIEQIQKEADIITLHVPLTKTGLYPTIAMIDAAFLARCERNPILINACRGAVTPTDDLVRAKKLGTISALVVDCWEGEPTIAQHLLRIADIATPHIAGFSADGKFKASRMALEAVAHYLGKEVNNLYDTSEIEAPSLPIINLRSYSESERIARALLHTFDPMRIDEVLRAAPESFEMLRRNYDYPREMSAYTAIIEPNESLRVCLERIGFSVNEESGV